MKKHEQKRNDNNKSVQKAQQPKAPSPDSREAQELRALVHQRHVQSFAGPIPPPKILEEYNRILPGAADRILAMAEKQAAHRQFLEQTVIKSDKWRSYLGLFLAFFVAVIFGVGGIYLILKDHSADGLVAMLTPLTVLVGSFIYVDWSRRKERSKGSRGNGETTEEQLPLPFE
jgi:uncharacterized membrane protein